MNHKRHKPNPKHDDYKVKDTSYRAGRAAVMQKKKEPIEDISDTSRSL